ncbi:unnamed protein product [Symbiodinium natans]|uniref:Uncharacterized protein n=1 Tax=Symbiodinium natans TaxID=878477 RepID=A0A812KE88_9DINO|nr:unnamed protein product [Symbiodinium natans]
MGRSGHPAAQWQGSLRPARLRSYLLVLGLLALRHLGPPLFTLSGRLGARGTDCHGRRIQARAAPAEVEPTSSESESFESESSDSETEAPWDSLAKTAADLFEDGSEFFVDTLKFAFQGEDELVADAAQNQSDASGVFGGVQGESLEALQEAVSTQAESLSQFLAQASSLNIAPTDFANSLSTVRRSLAERSDGFGLSRGGTVKSRQLP